MGNFRTTYIRTMTKGDVMVKVGSVGMGQWEAYAVRYPTFFAHAMSENKALQLLEEKLNRG